MEIHEKIAHTPTTRPDVYERLSVLIDALERAQPGLPLRDLRRLHARTFFTHRNTRGSDLEILLALPQICMRGPLVCLRREAS